MEKCLLTKLNGSSGNSELMKVGEMRIKISKVEVPTDTTQNLSIAVSKPITLEIIGEGYFTNNNLTENKGKTLVLNVGDNSIWVSNNDVEIAILDKYSINNFNASLYAFNRLINIAYFKYSLGLTGLYLGGTQAYGDIANLENLTNLTGLYLGGTQAYGDIANLKNLTNLTGLDLGGTPNISGDIANLKNLTNLGYLNLGLTQAYGDIANLKNLTNLGYLNVGTQYSSGDIGTLSGLINVTEINLVGGSFTGDLSKLPDSCKSIAFGQNNTVLSWTNRPSTAYILSITGDAKITDVDKMLQDQAQCQVGITESSLVYYKTISCVGNRTSASDAAVATLQSKGYTVSITPA